MNTAQPLLAEESRALQRQPSSYSSALTVTPPTLNSTHKAGQFTTANRRTTSPTAAKPNAPVTCVAAPNPHSQFNFIEPACSPASDRLARDRAVRFWKNRWLRGKYARDTHLFSDPGKSVFLPQRRPHLGQQRILHRLGQVGHLHTRPVQSPARRAAGNNRNAPTATFRDQQHFVADIVDGIHHKLKATRQNRLAGLLVKNSVRASTLQPGKISFTRLAISSTLKLPNPPSSAGNCRFTLVMLKPRPSPRASEHLHPSEQEPPPPKTPRHPRRRHTPALGEAQPIPPSHKAALPRQTGPHPGSQRNRHTKNL